MNTKPFINKDSNNFTVLVEDYVGEYDPPSMVGVTVRKDWDPHGVKDILCLEHLGGSHHFEQVKETIDPIHKKVFDTYLKRIKENKYEKTHLTECDFEQSSKYFTITFWESEEYTWDAWVQEYLNYFYGYLLNDLWKGRGADDDYFDYLPSITDVFFQLCKLFDAQSTWKSFIKELVALESNEVLEDSLYRHKF